MFTKIKIILLNIILLGPCCVSQAAEHNPIIENAITIDCKVENPLCICYLNSDCIAIGGSSGVQLVSKNGISMPEKYNQSLSSHIIYQLFPYNDSCYVAVDYAQLHVIDYANHKVIHKIQMSGQYFYEYKKHIIAHNNKDELDVQLYPRYMPKNISQKDQKNYVAAAVSSTQILALLDRNKNLEFWYYPENKEIATLKKTIGLSHVEPRIAGSYPFHIPYQRISFSPEGLDIAIALPQSCFIIPLPLSYLYGNKNVDKLISFLYYACKKKEYWLPKEIKYIIAQYMSMIMIK